MNKIIICIVALFLLGAGWVEGMYTGVPTDNSKRPIVFRVQVNTLNDITIPDIPMPTEQWITIDLTNGPQWTIRGHDLHQPDVPSDILAVFLSGQLIVSHPGGDVGTCDLWATFRAPGDDLPGGAWQIQTIEASSTKGVRSTAALFVPVVDRKFEVYWFHTPGCPSAITLSLQAYVR